MVKQEIWLSDLTRCEPAEAISRDGRQGTWIAVDYEIDAGSGVMLFGLPGSNVPTLRLRLNAKGWYQIRLGIFYGADAGSLQNRTLCAKLTGDYEFSRFWHEEFQNKKDGVYPEKAVRWFDLAEVFWKSADLTGQDLIIARPSGGTMSRRETNLAYVRLLRMDAAAVAEWESEQPSDQTKILMANYDGGSFGQWGIATPQDFADEFGCLRESDFSIALYGIARGPITLYPSKVGEFIPPSGFDGDGSVLRRLVGNGLDPLAEAIEAARRCGVQLFPQVRLIGTQLPPRHLRAEWGGRMMANHPEWLCTYPDGEPIRHLSLAFDGVRDFYIHLMREWVADYHADGVNVLFSRSFPFVYYEEPVDSAFQREYDISMRDLPASDRRVQHIRASFVTKFLRDIRSMLDSVGKTQRRHIASCYSVPLHVSGGITPDPPRRIAPEADMSALGECLYHGLEVPVWIKQGLVDYLIVQIHMFGEHDGSAVQGKIREFTRLSAKSQTKVLVDVYPRRMPPRQYRKIATNYYDAGADGLAFWDSYNRYPRASEWAFLKRLGHRDDLARWLNKGDDYYRTVPIRRLDGTPMQREFSRPSDG